MARAIIRTSINGPSPNNKVSLLSGILKEEGFTRIGTGAYEGDCPRMRDMTRKLRQVLQYLDGMESDYQVDHVWVYADGTMGSGQS